MRYHFIPVRMTIIKKRRHNVLDNVEKIILYTLGKNVNGIAIIEESMEVPQIKNKATVLSHLSTCGYLSKENKTLIQKDIYTLMFIAVLFIIAKVENQPKCHLWMNDKDVVFIHLGILQNHKKK